MVPVWCAKWGGDVQKERHDLFIHKCKGEGWGGMKKKRGGEGRDCSRWRCFLGLPSKPRGFELGNLFFHMDDLQFEVVVGGEELLFHGIETRRMEAQLRLSVVISLPQTVVHDGERGQRVLGVGHFVLNVVQ